MRATHRVEADLPDGLRPATFDDAYAIQRQSSPARCPPGGAPIGFKAACTSPIAQAALEHRRPVVRSAAVAQQLGRRVDAGGARFVHRVIEAEFAFGSAPT